MPLLEDAEVSLPHQALRNHKKNRKKAPREWQQARAQFTTMQEAGLNDACLLPVHGA